MLALRDYIDIWMLERRSKKARKKLQRQIQAATKRGEKMPATRIEDEEYVIHCQYQLSIEAIKSRSLIRQANKLYLDTPWLDPTSEACEFSDVTGAVYLTREALRKLKDAIREEKKKRFDDWSRWIPIITAIAGLLGTLTGLIAVWRRR